MTFNIIIQLILIPLKIVNLERLEILINFLEISFFFSNSKILIGCLTDVRYSFYE